MTSQDHLGGLVYWCHNASQLLNRTFSCLLCLPCHKLISDPVAPFCPAVTPFLGVPLHLTVNMNLYLSCLRLSCASGFEHVTRFSAEPLPLTLNNQLNSMDPFTFVWNITDGWQMETWINVWINIPNAEAWKWCESKVFIAVPNGHTRKNCAVMEGWDTINCLKRDKGAVIVSSGHVCQIDGFWKVTEFVGCNPKQIPTSVRCRGEWVSIRQALCLKHTDAFKAQILSYY